MAERGAVEARAEQPRLRRALGPLALAVYGIGGMLGGGIYALVGEVSGLAGPRAWLCFVLAMAVATPTAFTYARLAARHPRSAGEAWYCRLAFGGELLPFLVGWLVLLSGVVSMATLARAFAGYLGRLLPEAPPAPLVLAFLLLLAAINWRGIRATSWANVACTLIEAGGLIVVVAAGASFLWGGGGVEEAGARAAAPAAPAAAATAGLLPGAALAFYAFVGFEDMVNVAEEVQRPERAYRVAIPAALVAVGVVYAAVTAVAGAVVAPPELAASSAPLTLVVERSGIGLPPAAFTLVALFAVANSALLNFVMASRLAYGMAGEGVVPRWLGAVHPRRRTPGRAILVVLVLAVGLALSGGLAFLAGATSALLLAVFLVVNLAALRLSAAGGEGSRAGRVLPALGALGSAGLAPFLPRDSLLAALALLAAGALVLGAARLARARAA